MIYLKYIGLFVAVSIGLTYFTASDLFHGDKRIVLFMLYAAGIVAGVIIGLLSGFIHKRKKSIALGFSLVYLLTAVAGISFLYFEYGPKHLVKGESGANSWYATTRPNQKGLSAEELAEVACERLKMAIYHNDITIIGEQVQKGIQMDCISKGNTPLDILFAKKNDDSKHEKWQQYKIKIILKNSKNPGQLQASFLKKRLDNIGPEVTLLHVRDAILKKDYQMLSVLVEQFDVNTGDAKVSGRYNPRQIDNPLAMAILLGDPKSVKILLKAGADTQQKLEHTFIQNGKQQTTRTNMYYLALGMYQAKKDTQTAHHYIQIVNDVSSRYAYNKAERKIIVEHKASTEAAEKKQQEEWQARTEKLYRPLYDAIEKGDLNRVKQLIAKKEIDINFQENEDGWPSPLMASTEAQQVEIMKYLLKQGARADTYTADGETLLMMAAALGNMEIANILIRLEGVAMVNHTRKNALNIAIGSGDIDLVNFLLSKNPTLVPPGVDETSLINKAVRSKNVKMVALLIREGVDIRAKAKELGPLMETAVGSQSLDMVKYLNSLGIGLDHLNSNNQRPLDYANKEIADYLRKQGARSAADGLTEAEKKEIAQKKSKKEEAEKKLIAQKNAEMEAHQKRKREQLETYYDPFYAAVKKGDMETVKRLIESNKIYLNFQAYEEGYPSPLMAGVLAEEYKIVQYILTKGVDFTRFDLQGNTAFMMACAKGNFEIARLLLTRGARFYVNRSGEGPLFQAIRSGNEKLVSYLLEKGAALNHTEHFRRTPIHAAVLTENIKMVKFLIQLGVNIHAKDKTSGTLLHSAVLSKNLKMVKFVNDLDVDLTAVDHQNKTPLALAIENHHDEIANYLKSVGGI